MKDNIIFKKTADKLIACYSDGRNLKLHFESVDKIESVLNKTNSHPHNFNFYVNELQGCLVFMFYDYCNFPDETITSSLIKIDVDFTDYNKCLKDFTVQLLKLLYERANEKKVTNNE